METIKFPEEAGRSADTSDAIMLLEEAGRSADTSDAIMLPEEAGHSADTSDAIMLPEEAGHSADTSDAIMLLEEAGRSADTSGAIMRKRPLMAVDEGPNAKRKPIYKPSEKSLLQRELDNQYDPAVPFVPVCASIRSLPMTMRSTHDLVTVILTSNFPQRRSGGNWNFVSIVNLQMNAVMDKFYPRPAVVYQTRNNQHELKNKEGYICLPTTGYIVNMRISRSVQRFELGVNKKGDNVDDAFEADFDGCCPPLIECALATLLLPHDSSAGRLFKESIANKKPFGVGIGLDVARKAAGGTFTHVTVKGKDDIDKNTITPKNKHAYAICAHLGDTDTDVDPRYPISSLPSDIVADARELLYDAVNLFV